MSRENQAFERTNTAAGINDSLSLTASTEEVWLVKVRVGSMASFTFYNYYIEIEKNGEMIVQNYGIYFHNNIKLYSYWVANSCTFKVVFTDPIGSQTLETALLDAHNNSLGGLIVTNSGTKEIAHDLSPGNIVYYVAGNNAYYPV